MVYLIKDTGATKNCYKINKTEKRRRTAHAQGTLPEHVVGDGGEVLPPATAAARLASRRRRNPSSVRRQLLLVRDTRVHG